MNGVFQFAFTLNVLACIRNFMCKSGVWWFAYHYLMHLNWNTGPSNLTRKCIIYIHMISLIVGRRDSSLTHCRTSGHDHIWLRFKSNVNMLGIAKQCVKFIWCSWQVEKHVFSCVAHINRKPEWVHVLVAVLRMFSYTYLCMHHILYDSVRILVCICYCSLVIERLKRTQNPRACSWVAGCTNHQFADCRNWFHVSWYIEKCNFRLRNVELKKTVGFDKHMWIT